MLDFLIALFAFLLTGDGISGTYIPTKRRCGNCGTVFTAQREPRRAQENLYECAKCKYSLVGNVSGVCPECGKKLTEAQLRHIRELPDGERASTG